ncbi:hypothetical protein ABGB21_16775 [Plantactinospora sp. B24E8]
MRDLRAAVAGYRTAATAAGLAWPVPAESPAGQPPELVYRLFGVDRVPEQLAWLTSQGMHEHRLLPNGGWVEAWPTGGEPLDLLSLSIGTPFPWRQQMPLFHFEYIFYTFVLAGEHEGEIWRYELPPDTLDLAVRAAPSAAALFTEWTRGIAAGVVAHDRTNGWLQVGGGSASVGRLLERDLDPLAFPVSLVDEPLVRMRQRECGVDMARVELAHGDEGFDCFEELSDIVQATRASLGV